MRMPTLLLLSSLMVGCGDTFPQYSGKYQLEEYSYSKPEFTGAKRLAGDLTITHKMKYVPNTWDDKLRFEFTPLAQTEEGGAVVFDLELLVNTTESTFPQDSFKGEGIHDEKKYYGGAFCNYQYQYHAFATLTPIEALLSKVYPDQGAYLYTDPNGMPIYETFDPETFEPDQDNIDEWYDAIEDNGDEITLDFYLSRDVAGDFSGCDMNSYLPHDNRGSASLHALYHSTELDDTKDPRQGFEENLENTIPAIEYFEKVISEVKDL